MELEPMNHRLQNLRIRHSLFALVIGAVIFGGSASAQDRFAVDLEAGPVWQLRNDFAVPGDSGTLVRLEDRGPSFAARATLLWNVSDRWSLRFLAAPLSTKTDFVPEEDVYFQGAKFAKGQPVTVDYRFDSYRAGAFYRWPSSGRWSFRGGLTLKVRDAEIALRTSSSCSCSGAPSESKTNTGVVPLLYGGARYQASDRVAIDMDIDGAAASQGRAVDAAIRIETQVAGRTSLFIGGRLLDGGADNAEVVSFGTFAYAVGGVRVRW